MFYEYVIFFTIAFIIAFSATPVARKIAFDIGAVDIPKDKRRMHDKPIARLGGLAIFAGFIVTLMFGIIIAISNLGGIPPSKQLFGMLAGIFIIVALGIVDDIKPLDARLKLGVQIIAALVVIFVSDTRIMVLTNPFSDLGVSPLVDFISYPVTVIWIIAITNAINLIDGLDGLAAGVSSISCLTLFFVSAMMSEPITAMLTIILAGATLGFLPYNFNPAKIFMGDTGSTFLGFTLAVISIQGMLKSFTAISIAIPLLALALPLFDTVFTILRRAVNGKSIMQPDRGHLHHRLIDMGLSQKQSVIVMYTASGALGLCAIVLADKGVLSAIVLEIMVAVFVIAGARYMSEIGDGNPKHADKNEVKMSVSEVKDAEN
jgi:UDP-GlcNAc:undecaprenyl-phosphate GlcNAc-1-phosphate transferase